MLSVHQSTGSRGSEKGRERTVSTAVCTESTAASVTVHRRN